jgi:hypothetical protein
MSTCFRFCPTIARPVENKPSSVCFMKNNHHSQIFKIALTAALLAAFIFAGPALAQNQPIVGKDNFEALKKKAEAGRWSRLAVGERTAKTAYAMLGTPYKAGTLDQTAREIPSVNMAAVDCVTFVESALAFARLLKSGTVTAQKLADEVSYIRYRDGRADGYTSRLHYMSDWFFDNVKKGVVTLPVLPGAINFKQKVAFMSQHPQSYRQLRDNVNLISVMQKQEAAINLRDQLKYIPLDKIALAEPQLETGDIIAVTTNIAGLDVVHVGFVYRTADGAAHFLDASSKKSCMKVTLETTPFSKSFTWSRDLTGIIVARPLELSPR